MCECVHVCMISVCAHVCVCVVRVCTSVHIIMYVCVYAILCRLKYVYYCFILSVLIRECTIAAHLQMHAINYYSEFQHLCHKSTQLDQYHKL